MHLSWLHTVADALPKFLCPFCTLPPLLPVVGRGLVYCLRIAVFIPSAYLCPLFISLISLLSTFLEPSALPPHSLQCSEARRVNIHSTSSGLGLPVPSVHLHLHQHILNHNLPLRHILWSSLYISASAPLPYPQITSFPDRRSSGTPVPGPRLGLQHIHHGA